VTRSGTRTVAGWFAIAIAGLVIAVGVAYAASRLASPNVGLSSEPLSAGARLAPRSRPAPRPRPAHHGPKRGHPAPTPTAPPSSSPPAPPATSPPAAPAPAPAPTSPAPPSRDDSSGSGADDHGGGGHGGADD
jgi:hypothetical protein